MTDIPGEVPFQSPTDAEFEAFLSDATNDISFDFDKKAYNEGLARRIDAALKKVGYKHPLSNEDRRYELTEVIQDHFRDQGVDVTDPATDIDVQNVLVLLAQKEQLMIEQIRTLTIVLEIDEMQGLLANGVARDKKAGLMAKAEIVESFNQADPLLRAANLIIPGGDIQPDDPLLESKRLDAFEELANKERQTEEDLKELNQALDYIGVGAVDFTNEIPTDEKVKLIHTVAAMIVVGRVYTRVEGNNNAAVRLEKLYEMARDYTLDTTLTAKIIEYIENKYPFQI